MVQHLFYRLVKHPRRPLHKQSFRPPRCVGSAPVLKPWIDWLRSHFETPRVDWLSSDIGHLFLLAFIIV
jgi:hypothetical protein